MIKINRPIPADQIRLLIFDLHGTLVDSRQDLTNSVNAMLRHYSRPELPSELISTYIGDGDAIRVRRAMGGPDDQRFVDEALSYFLSYSREHKLDNTYVYEDLKDPLAAIRELPNG